MNLEGGAPSITTHGMAIGGQPKNIWRPVWRADRSGRAILVSRIEFPIEFHRSPTRLTTDPNRVTPAFGALGPKS